jgi:hypothetical protein
MVVIYKKITEKLKKKIVLAHINKYSGQQFGGGQVKHVSHHPISTGRGHSRPLIRIQTMRRNLSLSVSHMCIEVGTNHSLGFTHRL